MVYLESAAESPNKKKKKDDQTSLPKNTDETNQIPTTIMVVDTIQATENESENQIELVECETVANVESEPISTRVISPTSPTVSTPLDICVFKEHIISKACVEFTKTSFQWFRDKNPCIITIQIKGGVRHCCCSFKCSSRVELHAHLLLEHFGFLMFHICEQGSFKSMGTLKRHVKKYHQVQNNNSSEDEITPSLPQQFCLQNMLDKADEDAFNLINLSLRVVDSPFRNSYMKMELKYTVKDLIQVSWIDSHLNQIVQKNWRKLSASEQKVYMEERVLPRGRLPRYNTTASLLNRFFTFISSFHHRNLDSFAQHDIFNTNYWNKFFLFLEHKLLLVPKTISNLTDDLKNIISDMQLSPGFYEEHQHTIRAFQRYLQNYRSYLGVGQTRICFSTVTSRNQVEDMWTTQLEAGGILV